MRESTIEAYLVKQCKLNGWETRKVEWVNRSAAPDRLIFAVGGIWVELKAPGGKPRADQVREHNRMAAAGMQVHVIDSIAGVDELMSYIIAITHLGK